MIILAILFGVFALMGLLLIILDFFAMMNDVTPSQYNNGLTGVGTFVMIVCGLISLGFFAAYAIT